MIASIRRHLVSVNDLDAADIEDLLGNAAQLKRDRRPSPPPLSGRVAALIFEKPSLRTRMSFDVAMYELGGHAVYLSPAEVGLGRRESVADVARVVSRYSDIAILRTFAHETMEEFARYSTVPIVNGLSDLEHPCQGLSDLFTLAEAKGRLRNLTLAYVGDGNNVANALVLCAAKTGLRLRIACPEGYEPDPRYLARAREEEADLVIYHDARQAVDGADAIYTDVWTSMGQEAEYERRRHAFHGFQVNAQLLALARPDAIVLHDLPAHRGEEITDDVMDGPQSVVFEQAENRLHMQKAILIALLGRING
ncbi:MAG: ornithine carbamoyltransferase [Chloroflexi bacterium]|nr:MAG: ornithine carbamoyltransferase [Chloroflexota bacterium]